MSNSTEPTTTSNPSQLDTQSQSQLQSQAQAQAQARSQLDRTAAPNEAATKLIESIDDFLGDIEKKFKTISTEIFSRLDDMADRCDRLEQDMLLGGSAPVNGTTDGADGVSGAGESGARHGNEEVHS